MKTQFVRLLALSLPLAALGVSASAQPIYGYDPQVDQGARYDNRPNVNGDRIRGTVARVYSGRNFDLRLPNGDIVRIKTDYYTQVRPGDRVTAVGQFKGKTLYANFVNTRDDRPGYGNGNNTRAEVRGEVVAVDGPRTLRVRSQDTGRVVRVQTREDLNRRISRGDLVVVRGLFDGSVVRADYGQVRLLSDDNRLDGNPNTGNSNYGDPGYNNGNFGQSVSFPATVTSVRARGVEVRGDNGQTYIVRLSPDQVNDLRTGDRVQVQGTTGDGFIDATQLNRIR